MKTRCRFSHRAGDSYYWVVVDSIPESRAEYVHCRVDWFWSKPTMFELELRKRGWMTLNG